MLIQFHILQNYAPSNLNRDDTGAPKDAFFGGYRRGRVSSQCLKRSMRKSQVFAEAFAADGLLGTRTKKLHQLLAAELERMNVDASARTAILSRVAEIGRESRKEAAEEEPTEGAAAEEAAPELDTKQLIFVGGDELPRLAAKLVELYQKHGPREWNDTKKLKIDKITSELKSDVLPRSVDIALFGRMTTSDAFEDVHAAVQVSHALSTHALTQESDYYTAIDDLTTDPGAGMIGDVEFNSSCYYRYLNLHWEQLLTNLGQDVGVARRAVLALLRASVLAQPSGKQNSFAAQNPPDWVMVEVSPTNLAVSCANAFVRPVRAGPDQSLVDASVAALADYLQRLDTVYEPAARRCFTATGDWAVPGAERAGSLSALAAWLEARLPEG